MRNPSVSGAMQKVVLGHEIAYIGASVRCVAPDQVVPLKTKTSPRPFTATQKDVVAHKTSVIQASVFTTGTPPDHPVPLKVYARLSPVYKAVAVPRQNVGETQLRPEKAACVGTACAVQVAPSQVQLLPSLPRDTARQKLADVQETSPGPKFGSGSWVTCVGADQVLPS